MALDSIYFGPAVIGRLHSTSQTSILREDLNMEFFKNLIVGDNTVYDGASNDAKIRLQDSLWFLRNKELLGA